MGKINLLPELAAVLQDFQEIQVLTMLSLFEEQGVFGTLVDKIARIMEAINRQPFKEYTYRYKLLHNLT